MAGLVVLVTILAGLLLPGAASAKSAGDDAFLIESVDSVEDLVRQVEDSRLLVLRYAKHFRADPLTVIAYFRAELSIEELKEKTTIDVFKRKGTDVVSESKEFKAGAKVFVNRNGIPVLELGSGNPLVESLPGKDVKKLPVKPTVSDMKPTAATPEQPGTAPIQTQTAQAPTQTPGNQLPSTVPGSETAPLGTQTASAAGTEPEVAVLASGPIETVAKAAGRSGSGIGSLAGWVLPAGLAGAALLGGGGGAESQDNQQPIPVPEPTGLLAVGTGLASVACAAYRRTRAR